MSLTPAHVARVHRAVADQGLPSGIQLHDDADYDVWVAQIIGTHPTPDRATQLFAYGSLIWKPEITTMGDQPATAQGWHRSFCFRMIRFRGTHDSPGLMMALDRGGQCKGVLYDLPEGDLAGQLGRLFRREFTAKPANCIPRWIRVQTEAGPLPALTFVMNRASPNYTGRLAPAAVADVLAQSCGHWGTGAEYLMNTVQHLQARGIVDSGLWNLQRLVAERIEALPPAL